MKLKALKETYQIVKLKPTGEIPQDIFSQEVYSITRTEDEISIVVNSGLKIQSDNIENGWRIIKIAEVLDFSLTGVLSKISGVLADNDISIFVVSTYNTDYILIKEHYVNKAIKILTDNGYRFE